MKPVQEKTVPSHRITPPRVARMLGAVLLTTLCAATHAQDTAPHAHQARNLAATCANCHGTDGQARGDMRPLAGMPAETLMAMLNGYRSGALPATIMHQISKGYTEDQLRLIAGYFAAQKPRP